MKNKLDPIQRTTKKQSITNWLLAIVLMLTGISAFAAAPANDDFANATVIPASPPATVNGNNAEATFESNEPTHSDWSVVSSRGTNSVWWIWTPSASGSTTIDTVNSGFDTELAVYTGSSVGGLSQIAVNEDDGGLANGWSKLTFNAVSGTTYHIAVAGFENANGAIALNFSDGGTVVTGLVLTVNTIGSGTVTTDPTQPGNGYDSNTVVNLTAVPTGTNTLVSWSGTDNDASTNLTNTVTMTGNKVVTATFTVDGGGGGGDCGDLTSIIVNVNGNGRVSPDLNGKNNLVICRNYRISAKPAKDWIFAGWTGVSSNENNARLSFTMQPGMIITANFVPNPFLPVSGTYNGLFFDSNVTTSCSGGFTIKVQKTGRFSAIFSNAGKKATASGTFDSNGHAEGTAGRGSNLLTYSLQLSGLASADVAEGTFNSDKVTGTVTTFGGCLAQLEGDRQVFSTQNPAPHQGVFTFVLPRNATSGTQTNDVITTNIVVLTNNPGTSNELVVTNITFETNSVVTPGEVVLNPGHSFGTLTIDKTGRARIRGELADGSRFNQNTTISKDMINGTGQVPLYVSLYRGTGMLIGWLNVSSNDVSGTVNWERPGGALLFPEGFDANIEVIGSPFDRTIMPSLSISNGIVKIGGNSFEANSAEPLMIPVQMSRRDSFTGDNVSLRLSNGSVRGTFVSPVTLKSTPLTGVVLQNRNEAYGYFFKSGTRGYFELHGVESSPEPQVP